jgi:hypothetical protein
MDRALVIMFAGWVAYVAPPPAPKHPPGPPAQGATVVAATRSIASNWHTCARSRDGHVWCWGANRQGELGVAGPDRTRPVELAGLTGVAGVAAGVEVSCAWTVAGAVWCWGGERALGPTRVPGLADVVELVAGDRWTCARRGDGTVACFREASWSGIAPVTPVASVRDAIDLAVGDRDGCARQTGGRVACWRFPDAAGAAVPRDVPEAAGTTGLAIYAGYPDELFVVGGRQLRRIELRAPGEAENELMFELPARPASVEAPAHVTRLAAGQAGVCALGDAVTCWDNDLIARAVPASAGATDLAVGKDVACLRTATGHPACWGSAEDVGDGSAGGSDVPVEVPGVHDVVQLAASRRICAREATGRVACWGDDFAWDRGPVDAVPVAIKLPPARQLVVGDSFACARDGEANVWCWGLELLEPDRHRVLAPGRIAKLHGATTLVPAPRTICGMVRGVSTCVGELADDLAGLVPDGTTHAWWAGRMMCTQVSGPAVRCGLWPWTSRRASYRRIGKQMARDPGMCILMNDRLARRDVDLGRDVVAFGVDLGRTCVVRGSGTIECDREPDGPLVPIAGVRDAVGITGDAACVLRRDGHVACGKLGVVGGRPLTEVPGIDDAVEIVGHGFACVRRKTGRVACWGPNSFLGNGSSGAHDAPTALGLEI